MTGHAKYARLRPNDLYAGTSSSMGNDPIKEVMLMNALEVKTTSIVPESIPTGFAVVRAAAASGSDCDCNCDCDCDCDCDPGD